MSARLIGLSIVAVAFLATKVAVAQTVLPHTIPSLPQQNCSNCVVVHRKLTSITFQPATGVMQFPYNTLLHLPAHYTAPIEIAREKLAKKLAILIPAGHCPIGTNCQPPLPPATTIRQLILNADTDGPVYTGTYGTGILLETAQFPTLTAFNFNAESLLAGNVIKGDLESIQSGQISSYGLEAGGGTVQIDTAVVKPGAPTSEHVADASTTALNQARNDLENAALVPDQTGSLTCDYENVQSNTDAVYKAGLSFGYLSYAKVSDEFSSVDTSKTSHVLIQCQEAFLTLSYTPDAASDGVQGLETFFSPNVSFDAAKQFITPDDPPLFVSEVTYGAQLYLIANSDLTSKEMDDDLKASFNVAGVSGSAALTVDQKTELSEMDINVLALGGRASGLGGLSGVFTGTSAATDLVNWLQNNTDISASGSGYNDTGVPLSYQINYLDLTPVAETAAILGDPNVGTAGIFQKALVYFYSDGDGKDTDTVLDLAVLDQNGNPVGSQHILNTGFPNNQQTSTFEIDPLSSNITEGALDDGFFDVTIHPVGKDTWKYTAYIALCYNDPVNKQNNSEPRCGSTGGFVTEKDYTYSDQVSNWRKYTSPYDPSGQPHTNDSKVQFSKINAPPAPPKPAGN